MSILKISPKYFLGSLIPNVKILSSKIDEIITKLNSVSSSSNVVTANTIIDTTSTYVGTFIPISAQQALSGAGAINITSYYTAWTTTGANAGTLANGVVIGQLKCIKMIVDGGDGTLTPVSLSGGTTITFNDANDEVLLCWNGIAWVVLKNEGCTLA